MLDELFGIGTLSAKAIRRSLLRFGRKPIEYRFDRLPAPEEYADMEFAFREDYFEQPKSSGAYLAAYVKFIVLGLAALFFLFTFGPFALVGLLLFFIYILPDMAVSRVKALGRRASFQLSATLVLTVLLAITFLLADYIRHQFLITLLLGQVAILSIRFFHKDLSEFYLGWLRSHPSVTNDERRCRAATEHRPNYGLAQIVVLLLAALPHFSDFLTHVLFLAITTLSLIHGPIFGHHPDQPIESTKRFIQVSGRMFAEYFNYGSRFGRPLPGVWAPRRTHIARRRIAVMSLFLLFLTLASGTALFFPWDTPGIKDEFIALATIAEYENEQAWTYVREAESRLIPEGTPTFTELTQLEERLQELRASDFTSLSTDEQLSMGAEIEDLKSQIASAKVNVREVLEHRVGGYVDGWFELILASASTAPLLAVGSILYALLAALIYPTLLLLAILQKPVMELAGIEDEINLRAAKQNGRSQWDCFVERLRASQHTATDPLHPEAKVRESDHLFLGLEAERGFPVLLDKDILSDHVYISGGTGSGKTSLGILSLIVQLIRGSRNETGESDSASSAQARAEMPPLVIIDLKGEYSLLHTVREEVVRKAAEEGRTLQECFRLFSSEKDMPTHYFNPLSDMRRPDRYLADLCNLLLDALELNHGPGYGRSYFSRKNYMVLHELLRANSDATFAELSEAIAKFAKHDKDGGHQAFELLATLYGLAEFEQLHPPADLPAADAINMTEVIQKRQVVYFWLPTVESSIIAREIANLALFSYFSAMRAQSKARGPMTQGYLVVDEFQKLAGDRFSVILQQARGFGLSAILSNQSIADLNTAAFDLRPTVLQNTRMKLYFSFADFREMRDFAMRSGEELAYTRSGVYDLADTDEPDIPLFSQWHHTIKTRITTNDVLNVSDHPLQAFAEIRTGSGYTQFGGTTLPVQMFHPVRWSDFVQRRDTMPWPTLDDLGRKSAVVSSVSPEEVDRRAMEALSRLEAKVQGLDEEFPNLRFS